MVRVASKIALCAIAGVTIFSLHGDSPRQLAGQRFPAAAHGVNLIFKVDVPAPTRMTVCAGKLWVYDHTARQLVSLNLDDGRASGRHDVSVGKTFRHISALSCRENSLIIAIELTENPSTSRILKVPASSAPTLIPDSNSAYGLKGRIDDVFCGVGFCYLLSAGKLMRWSLDSTPKAIPLPALRSVVHREVNLEENPFSGWNDRHTVADGRITRGRIAPSGNLLLLDPFRANFVSVAFEKSTPILSRFGKWGVWEGYILNAKAVQPLENGGIAIADAGLRAVTLLSNEGNYAGLLPHEFDWPTDLAISGRKIYVADYKANRVLGFEFAKNWAPAALDSGFVRKNLFRREGRAKDLPHERCLACHDGTVTDELDHFLAKNLAHPIDIKQDKPGVLPLDPSGMMSCMSCHDPHHGADIDSTNEVGGDLKSPFLRKRPPSLCLDCHTTQANKGANHPLGPGLTCTNCHGIHGGVSGKLVPTKDRLCLDCHKPQAYRHKIVDVVLETTQAKNLRFEAGHISCTTCHQPHGSNGKHILRASQPLQEFCASCHGAKTPALFKDFHKRIRTRGEKWTP